MTYDLNLKLSIEENGEINVVPTRKNGEWDIIVAVQTDTGVEVVIGDRHTAFEPFVVWYCYNKEDYRDGIYLQTYTQAIKFLAMRLMPISEAHEMVEQKNYLEECDCILPYLHNDEGKNNAEKLYKSNHEFRQKVAECYGTYWNRYLDENTSDIKYYCAIDALSKAYEEWEEYTNETL